MVEVPADVCASFLRGFLYFSSISDTGLSSLPPNKVFFLAPPTERNIRKFEKWSKEAQQDIFFGNLCDNCHMVTLEVRPLFSVLGPERWHSCLFCVVWPGGQYVYDSDRMDACRLHAFGLSGVWRELPPWLQYGFVDWAPVNFIFR